MANTMTDAASHTSAKISDPAEIGDMLRRIDTATLDYELRKAKAIREWAIAQVCDFAVGDKVVIDRCPIGESSGWWPNREALAPGQTATVRSIDYNPYHHYWYADIVLDREWTVVKGWRTGDGPRRYWHGPAADTPEGYVAPSDYEQEHYPEGRKHTFAFPVEWLRKA